MWSPQTLAICGFDGNVLK